jgi:putative transcriptional regulator
MVCTDRAMPVIVEELHVAPGLLIAMPQLRDPNFDRSVVLMIEHRDEGSFGLVINRPTRTPVGDLLKTIDVDWHGTSGEVAWSGGPVQPETGWILHERVEGLAGFGTREIFPGLFITSAPDALRELAKHPPRRVRFLLGYSGWGPAQLEKELTETTWINSDVDLDVLFETPPDRIWETALRRMNIAPEALAPAHGIH